MDISFLQLPSHMCRCIYPAVVLVLLQLQQQGVQLYPALVELRLQQLGPLEAGGGHRHVATSGHLQLLPAQHAVWKYKHIVPHTSHFSLELRDRQFQQYSLHLYTQVTN